MAKGLICSTILNNIHFIHFFSSSYFFSNHCVNDVNEINLVTSTHFLNPNTVCAIFIFVGSKEGGEWFNSWNHFSCLSTYYVHYGSHLGQLREYMLSSLHYELNHPIWWVSYNFYLCSNIHAIVIVVSNYYSVHFQIIQIGPKFMFVSSVMVTSSCAILFG